MGRGRKDKSVEAEPARVKAIVPLLAYQREDVECAARFRWNCWSRQTGKSFTKSLRRILRGLQRRRTQVFLSAGERQSRELMAKARQHCEALKIATDYYDSGFFKDLSIKQLEMVLPGGVVTGEPFGAGGRGDLFTLTTATSHRTSMTVPHLLETTRFLTVPIPVRFA